MIEAMRTTLDIDNDILESAKELAAKRRTTMGRVLSDLARIALAPRKDSKPNRNGVPILPKSRDAKVVTPEIVNRLRDES
jgi:uncharacterized protein